MPRRMVTIDDENGKSKLLSDTYLSNPFLDQARPGFKRYQLWLTGQTPAALESLLQIDSSKEILSPPTNGSVLHIYHFPPDDHWIADVKEQDVKAYFSAFQESNLSLYSRGKHPYYQKSKSLEFCIILKGEITLILDKEDVHLRQGDTVVQKGSNHAWSNHSNEECILAISSHSGEGV